VVIARENFGVGLGGVRKGLKSYDLGERLKMAGGEGELSAVRTDVHDLRELAMGKERVMLRGGGHAMFPQHVQSWRAADKPQDFSEFSQRFAQTELPRSFFFTRSDAVTFAKMSGFSASHVILVIRRRTIA
jgi:hypothetical protein